jgi:hypothetical protein
MSYDQSLAVSLTADSEVMYDLERLGGYIDESFVEVHAAAKPRRRRARTVPETEPHEVSAEATATNGAAAQRVHK